ncbi:SGT1-domain-containing protein [Gonapodya prolifera JEL478]|uniref:SGT1-domain-containing protein n=1 Tax=Gonapodya prolifera (strain JEL478) TaxID=1344416 RepID=A0A139AP28_GONPJ|nr:SGT1-domain-containing protein [Gonapodya prolifera JEL478]|eukprot:KXS18478.1 SGT1-domain-containing protein [Gonapodya prolifera JEL478]
MDGEESPFLSLLRSGALTAPDDVLEYAVYLPPPDQNTSAVRYRENLDRILMDITAFVIPYIKDYTWTSEGFNLAIFESGEADPPYPFLRGSTSFSDAVEDEWVLIWLLYQISRKVEGAVVSLSDPDGPPDLIHAAPHLPPWLDPSTSPNRCFVHDGSPHIIPLKYPLGRPRGIPAKLSLSHALTLVRDRAQPTLASTAVHGSIERKLSRYPNALKESAHSFACRLPLPAARAIHADWDLAGLALARFLGRTPGDMGRAADMKGVLGRTAPGASNGGRKDGSMVQWVRMITRVSRRTYARATGMKFYPPKVVRGVIKGEEGGKEWTEWDIGVKLAVGLEMLFQDRPAKPSSDLPGRPTVDSYDFTSDARWAALRKTLEQNGVAVDESQVIKTAQTLHICSVASRKSASAISGRKAPAFEPQSPAWSRLERAFADTIISAENLDVGPDAQGDDEDWLKSGEMDDALSDGDGDLQATDENWDDVQDAVNGLEGLTEAERREAKEMAKIVSGFTKFVDGDGGLGGARIDGDPDSDDDMSESSDEASDPEDPLTSDSDDDDDDPLRGPSRPQSKPAPTRVTLDPDAFLDVMRRVLEGRGATEATQNASRSTVYDMDIAVPESFKVHWSTCPRDDMVDSDDETEPSASDSDDGPSLSDEEALNGRSRAEPVEDDDEGDPDLMRYMAQMDAELSGTKVAEGFEVEGGSDREVEGSDQEDEASAEQSASKGSGRASARSSRPQGSARPKSRNSIDLDLNLVRNILESIRAGDGDPGPGHGLLGRLGVNVGLAAGSKRM